MKEILKDVRLEYAIQILYDYIKIINERIESEDNKEQTTLLQQQKEKLQLEIKEVYNGNEKVIANILEKYFPIVKQYYNKGKVNNEYGI